MKFRTTIILAIVAIIGFAYIYLWDKKQYRTEEWKQRQQMVLPDYKEAQIGKIEIIKEKERIVLEKIDEGHWKMLEPLQLRADKAEVKEILTQFEFLRKVGTIKESEIGALKNYGLDNPQVTVQLWRKGGVPLAGAENIAANAQSKVTMSIGDKVPAGQNTVYVMVEGENDVFVVTGRLLEKVSKHVNVLRNKWVFEFDEDAIERIKIQGEGRDTIMCSKEDQLWWLSQPITDRADHDLINGILNELKNLEINQNDFVSDNEEDLSKLGLDNPRLSISIGYRDQTQTIHLGHSLDDKVYAKRDDESSIFLVHDVMIKDFDIVPNDMRDRQLLRFDSIGTYGIEKVELKYPDVLLTMEKTKQYDWMIKSPVEILADRDTVRDFVEKIKEIQIQEFIDDSGDSFGKFGLEESPIEVSVFRKLGEGETVKLMVGGVDENGGLCYVRRAGENSVYSIPTEDFYPVIKRGLLAFRDRVVLETPKENAQKIVVERDGKTFVCKKKVDNVEKWFLTEPVNVEADIDAINQMIWNMSFLKADMLVALSAEDLNEYGLDNPGIRASVTYEGLSNTTSNDEVIAGKEDLVKPLEEVTKTLLIGGKVEPEKGKSSYFAKVAGEDLIFQIGWPIVRDFSVELATKTLFELDIAQAKSLEIKHSEKELSFKRNENNKWEMIHPENKLLEGNFVDRVLSAMNALKAESIVQYSGGNLAEFELDEPQLSITVGSDEGENSLLIGKKTKNKYFVMNQLDFVYLVEKNKIESIRDEVLSSQIQ